MVHYIGNLSLKGVKRLCAICHMMNVTLASSARTFDPWKVAPNMEWEFFTLGCAVATAYGACIGMVMGNIAALREDVGDSDAHDIIANEWLVAA